MRYVLIAVVLLAPLGCFAEPLVTITCGPPKGLTQRYGVTASEAMKAASDHKPRPLDHLAAPINDDFNARPTFIVDSSRKKLTLIWAETAGEAAMREFAKEHGTVTEPDPAREVPVIAYSPIVITAMDAHPGKNGAVMLYSFYPKLGVLFVAQHYLDIEAAYAAQSAFFAKCQFSWSGNP
jgi:hypothetical protein